MEKTDDKINEYMEEKEKQGVEAKERHDGSQKGAQRCGHERR